MNALTKPILPPFVLPLSFEAERELTALTLAFPDVRVDELLNFLLDSAALTILWGDSFLGHQVQLRRHPVAGLRALELYEWSREGPTIRSTGDFTSFETLFRWLREQLAALHEKARWVLRTA